MTGDILEAIDNAVTDWETSDDAMRWTPEPPPPPEPVVPTQTMHVVLRPDTSDVAPPAGHARGFIVSFFGSAHDLHALRHPKAHRRCWECRPHANPPPLPIDGHEYNRRRRKRSKR